MREARFTVSNRVGPVSDPWPNTVVYVEDSMDMLNDLEGVPGRFRALLCFLNRFVVFCV